MRRPAVWSPGDTLVIDWGVLFGLHGFCVVLAWSRWRFVRFAADEKATTTLGLLAEYFETLGGVPKVVLADRMGCLKRGVVANLVVPTPDYVRFATHYRFRPDFCHAHDPESKGIVENLVGYAKRDLMIPTGISVTDLAAANEQAARWCVEVNAVTHSEIAAVPAQRLEQERELLGGLPSLRPDGIGGRPIARKVDKLSCVRFGSARYSVPNRFIATSVLAFNPASHAVAPRERPNPRTPWTAEQLATFLEAAQSDRFYAMWVLAATTGMRRSECSDAISCQPSRLPPDAATMAISDATPSDATLSTAR